MEEHHKLLEEEKEKEEREIEERSMDVRERRERKEGNEKMLHSSSYEEDEEGEIEIEGDTSHDLQDDGHPSLTGCFRSFIKSYRSTNPQSTITPFAIVLLIVLLLIYILNQADRLVLAVLIPSGLRCTSNDTSTTNDTCIPSVPSTNYSSDNTSNNISDDCIVFNDYEHGLLTGPAFVIVYVIGGLPLAYLADTRSRSLVLLFGMVFWSIMVLLTGFVTTFWQLLLLRIFLGIGEASYNPVAYSLLADFFPQRNRACVFAVYNYGVYFGGSFGWMSGAINHVLDWRWTFILLGIVGLAMIPLAMMALWEPKDIREKRKERIKGKSQYTIWEVFKYLITCPPYLMLLVAGSIRNISGYALGYWLPTYYVRAFGLSSGEFGPKVGLVVLFGGGIGCFIGGLLSDWLSRYRQGAKAYVIACSQLLAVPAIAGVLLVNSPDASFGLLVIAYITAETWLGPAAAIVQDISLPAMRAQAAAVYIGVITIVASIGPVLVPFFNENIPSFSADCLGLRYALLCTVPTFYFISSILFVVLALVMKCWANRPLNKDSYALLTDELANASGNNNQDNLSQSPSATDRDSD
jgi:MFS family permease